MANYIMQMQDEAEVLKAEIKGLRSGIRHLMDYLSSSKFNLDNTVQVRDVLMRLHGTENLALDMLLEETGNRIMFRRDQQRKKNDEFEERLIFESNRRMYN